MIELERVSFTYPGAATPALRDVSLSLPAGSLTLVSGPSGSGKSTLLRCLNGLVPHFSGGVLRGRVRVAGHDPVAEGPMRLSRVVGFVQQDPESQFITGIVEDELAFGLENVGWTTQAMRARVAELLTRLQLTHVRCRRVETLSGGEQQRVIIASVLAPRPSVLVLDEPTSQLDADGAREGLALLASLKAEGLTIVVAEHRIERILPFADFWVGVEAGRATCHPVTAAMRATLASPRPSSASVGRGEARLAANVVLAAEGLTARYGTHTVFEDLNLTLSAGELVALVGPNGSGKTTLLRTLMGLHKSVTGRVLLEGRPMGEDVALTTRRMALLPQDPNALLFAESVLEELAITLRNHGLEKTPPIAPEVLLAELGLSEVAGAYPRDLSAGQRQRVALAALLVTRPRVLLLDEPTRGLDARAKEDLLALLQRFRVHGMAILVATHDVPRFTDAADRVVALKRSGGY